MADHKTRAIKLNREPDRSKVLLSIAADDLRVIDENADAAGMSRSAYLASVGKAGRSQLFEAIDNLKAELRRFEADGAGWRAETKRLQDHNIVLQRQADGLRKLALEILDMAESNLSKETVARVREGLKSLRV